MENPTWIVDCGSGCGIQYEQTDSGRFPQAPHCCGNCGNEAIRIRLLVTVPPDYFVAPGIEPYRPIPNAEILAPETAENGLWYCYDKQAWIRRGIVEPCGHPMHQRHGGIGCYACVNPGVRHGVCPSCH